ncbi:hypothetical protein pdam_00001618 [Pocillopora damicornis]|uniref:Uncharacterized protein n=1 Tax=Pocillopora damicornis TaxID=46731 RepID=A0A3M6U5T0_POCDA|nr:hypothetical protein pdam_00001618 [Pocillopora damicornis]
MTQMGLPTRIPATTTCSPARSPRSSCLPLATRENIKSDHTVAYICLECQDDMVDYERILEAQTQQKIYRTRVFFKLLKLVKEENLKTATELIYSMMAKRKYDDVEEEDSISDDLLNQHYDELEKQHQTCYDMHKEKKICDSIVQCPMCRKEFEPLVSKEPHQCYFDKCFICHEYGKLAEHKCFMQPVAAKEDQRKKPKQP